MQNIGGIAKPDPNSGRASAERIIAFDTGPGNTAYDAVTQKLFGKPFDRDGNIAASGGVIEPIIARPGKLRRSFRAKPPKDSGREEFGREFVAHSPLNADGARKQDIVATATALTAKSIAHSVSRLPNAKARGCSIFRELILPGGGARNATLVAMLAEQMAPLERPISDEFGCPPRPKKPLLLPSWLMRPAIAGLRTARQPRARRAAVLGCRTRSGNSGCSRQCGQDAPHRQPARGRRDGRLSPPLYSFRPHFSLLFPLISCSNKSDANTLVMIIESSPTNLDPRVGIDAQSERIQYLTP